MTKLERDILRTALADYMWSEGCECCQDSGAHNAARDRLAKLLNVKKYKDGSGWNFQRYRTVTP